MLSARAMTLFTVAVAISLSFLSCGQDEMERIAEKPIEARSADEIRRFLIGRWKLGENRLDGVYISRDSIKIIDEQGRVDEGHPWGGEVKFMSQSRITVKQDSVDLKGLAHIDTQVEDMGKSVDSNNGYYITPIKVVSRDSIKWWVSEEPQNWGAVLEREPVLVRAEGSSVALLDRETRRFRVE